MGGQGIQKCGTNATPSVGGRDGDGVQIPFVGVAFGVGEETLRRVKVALLQGSGERQVNQRFYFAGVAESGSCDAAINGFDNGARSRSGIPPPG